MTLVEMDERQVKNLIRGAVLCALVEAGLIFGGIAFVFAVLGSLGQP
jgi:hypothetical protein